MVDLWSHSPTCCCHLSPVPLHSRRYRSHSPYDQRELRDNRGHRVIRYLYVPEGYPGNILPSGPVDQYPINHGHEAANTEASVFSHQISVPVSNTQPVGSGISSRYSFNNSRASGVSREYSSEEED